MFAYEALMRLCAKGSERGTIGGMRTAHVLGVKAPLVWHVSTRSMYRNVHRVLQKR